MCLSRNYSAMLKVFRNGNLDPVLVFILVTHRFMQVLFVLVLSPGTGHVSLQYHVVFDDEFRTVRHLCEGTVPKNWRELVESSSFSSTDQQYSLAETWLNQNALDPDDSESAVLSPVSHLPVSHPSSPSGGADSSSATTPIPLASERDLVGSPAVQPEPFVSKGDVIPLSSKGAESPVPFQLPACKGDDLRMPEFVNLETSGLCCLARLSKRSLKALEVDQTPEKNRISQFNFFNSFGGSNLYLSLAKHRMVMQSTASSVGQSFCILMERLISSLHLQW